MRPPSGVAGQENMMHDRRQLLWPRDEWPLIRRVALTIAACQLVAFLAVGALVWRVDSGKPAGNAVKVEARLMP